MPTKVFVGRIAEGTSGEDIKALFRKFGTVTECDVLSNFGFVHMETEDEAKAAIAALDGYNVNGSHIHVELSTANTQGRKKRNFDNFRGNGRGGNSSRYEPYPHNQRRDSYQDGGRRGGGPMPDHRGSGPPMGPPPGPSQREEYASEQVKDLLELYFRDPYAFDQYARTYYYGERTERSTVAAPPAAPAAGPRGYYDKRPEAGYSSSRREDDLRGGPASYSKVGYGSSSGGYDPRDSRSGGGGPPYPSAYK